VALDHADAGAHDARELEDRDAGGERVAGEGGTQIVDAYRPCDARRLDCGCPLPAAPVVELQHAAERGGEHERGVELRWDGVQRGERAARQRHLPPCARGLAELDDLAVADGAQHVDRARPAVDVAPLERLPLLGAESRRRGEEREGGVRRGQLGAQRGQLVAGEDPDLPGRRLTIAAREMSGVAAHVAPAHGRCQRLPQRLHDAVARSLGKPNLPGADLARHALELAQRDVAERADSVRQPLAQRDDGAGSDPGGVPLEVDLDEATEREVGQRDRLPAKLGLDDAAGPAVQARAATVGAAVLRPRRRATPQEPVPEPQRGARALPRWMAGMGQSRAPLARRVVSQASQQASRSLSR
jgi:hypothetical protein